MGDVHIKATAAGFRMSANDRVFRPIIRQPSVVTGMLGRLGGQASNMGSNDRGRTSCAPLPPASQERLSRSIGWGAFYFALFYCGRPAVGSRFSPCINYGSSAVGRAPPALAWHPWPLAGPAQGRNGLPSRRTKGTIGPRTAHLHEVPATLRAANKNLTSRTSGQAGKRLWYHCNSTAGKEHTGQWANDLAVVIQ